MIDIEYGSVAFTYLSSRYFPTVHQCHLCYPPVLPNIASLLCRPDSTLPRTCFKAAYSYALAKAEDIGNVVTWRPGVWTNCRNQVNELELVQHEEARMEDETKWEGVQGDPVNRPQKSNRASVRVMFDRNIVIQTVVCSGPQAYA